MISRGFVLRGSLAAEDIGKAAAEVEQLGYGSCWITVTPGRTDPLAVLDSALSATTAIEVGLGLVPLDMFGGAEIGALLQAVPDAARRAVIGLGVGRRRAGAAAFWAREADGFRRAAPDLRLAVGGYGPRVLRAGGATADAVLLNWMTPQRLTWSIGEVDVGAARVGRRSPRPVYLYVPAAVEPGGRDRIQAAQQMYLQHEYHRRHQQAMGNPNALGIVATEKADIGADLAKYVGAVPIVNPVGSVDHAELTRIMEAFSPLGLPSDH
jgi:alkanesulfonate monooxygenase SsuD/methylene tetrahydromethanopterin reductase-like flavin-dependent oxidoreductase (luciferase family)